MHFTSTLLGLLAATGAFAQYDSADHTLEARKAKGLSNGVTLRIMPLGASVTWGQGSTKGNGYRKELRELLTKEGNPVNMVGTRKNGDFKDNEVEGWPGFTIDQVRDKAMSKDSVEKFKPNVVLLNAGTNDAVQDKDVAKAGERLERLINDVLGKSKKTVVIASTLLNNRKDDVQKRVKDINEQYRKVVAKLQKAKKRVLIVDMAGSEGPSTKKEAGEYADDTHPNDKGYKKMADLWAKGIKDAARRKWIAKPEGGLFSKKKSDDRKAKKADKKAKKAEDKKKKAADTKPKKLNKSQIKKGADKMQKKINDQVKKDILNEKPKWVEQLKKDLLKELKKDLKCKA